MVNGSVFSLEQARHGRVSVLVCLFAAVVLLTVAGSGLLSSVPAFANDGSDNSAGSAAVGGTSDDGLLQLDTGIITNSSGGAGSVGDFPVRGELFSSELSQAAEQARASGDRLSSTAVSSIDFSSKPVKSKPTGDYASTVSKLFGPDYKPVDLSVNGSGTQHYDLIWYVLIIAGGVVLMPVAIWLGIWTSDRKVRKQRLKRAQEKAAEEAEAEKQRAVLAPHSGVVFDDESRFRG